MYFFLPVVIITVAMVTCKISPIKRTKHSVLQVVDHQFLISGIVPGLCQVFEALLVPIWVNCCILIYLTDIFSLQQAKYLEAKNNFSGALELINQVCRNLTPLQCFEIL